ncbi:MAG: decaprenyl-phosphate phosphoribosyltransferase [Armatimonadetes bacterium]|jgi:4-hydroxybenzoate polyprenyltransferase|nr:decaprenyl-phosphate phosphoribosyltransferase [Armatimonadota bacterium]
MSLPLNLFKAMRPKQWTKNLLLFAALLFAKEYAQADSVLRVVAAFVLFCILSGTVYLVNDVADLEQDRNHPRKRLRPIASGALSPGIALAAAAILAPLCVVGCFFVSTPTGLVAVAYLGLTLSYHFMLKHVVILDALAVSGGFVLRAVAGAEAIQVEISPWLLLCTLLLALFLTFTKRRQELVALEEDARTTRQILSEYTPELLDQMIAVVTASTLMSYCLYTISDRTVGEVGSRDLIFTIPLVIYGIFRYLYLVHRHGQGEAPDRVLLTDAPLLATVALYVVVVAIIFYLAGGGLGGPLLPANGRY